MTRFFATVNSSPLLLWSTALLHRWHTKDTMQFTFNVGSLENKQNILYRVVPGETLRHNTHTFIKTHNTFWQKLQIIQSWKLDQKPKAGCQLDNGLCYIMLVIDWCYTTPVYDTHAVVHLKVSKSLPAKDPPWCLSLSIDACVKLLCESVGCKDCHLFWSMAGTKILFVFSLCNKAENEQVHTYAQADV